jgi:glutamate racemase
MNLALKPVNRELLIGVIGGTPMDSELGVNFLCTKNIQAISENISDNPFDQTNLQLSRTSLTNIVRHKINKLLKRGCGIIFIYCNSLSGSVDLDCLRNYFEIPILTPMETYGSIANQYNSIGLIAANCQSLGHIETMILKTNPQATVTGFSSLHIVDSIEKGLTPPEVINKFNLLSLCKLIQSYGSDVLILGCTHFSWFNNTLTALLDQEKIALKLFDPSETMYSNLLFHQDNILFKDTLAHS